MDVKHSGSDHPLCISDTLTSIVSDGVTLAHLDDDCMEMDYELDYEWAAVPLILASPPFGIWKEKSVAVYCLNSPPGKILWNLSENGP